MKVAIYARVSTEEQDADKQEQACLEYCKRHDHEVIKVYKDQGVSGTKTSRPETEVYRSYLRGQYRRIEI